MCELVLGLPVGAHVCVYMCACVQFDTATVTVVVLDINDMSPVFTQSTYTFGIDENQNAGTAVDGNPLISVSICF